jgi:O-antigen/teichoic acid export membrane protein
MWGLLDQALISASNFAVTILLARELGPSAFGKFVIAYTVLLFVNSVHGALFAQPHNVLGPGRTGADYREFTTVIAWAQGCFAMAASLLIAAIGLLFVVAGESFGVSLAILAPAVLAWQLQEFARRVLYTQFEYRNAFVNDLISYGGQLVAVLAIWRLGALTSEMALAAIGLTSAAGAGVGFWQIRTSITRMVNWPEARRQLERIWSFGRWLLAGTLSSWTSTHLYPILAAGFVGVGAAGGLRSAQNLVAPTHIAMKTVESILPSRAANEYVKAGKSALSHYVARFALPVGFALSAYCIVVSVVAKPLVTALLGTAYVEYWWLVPVMACAYILTYTASIASIYLQCVGLTKSIFHANLASSLIVLTIGILIVGMYGLIGTAVGLILHGIVLNGILWWKISNNP